MRSDVAIEQASVEHLGQLSLSDALSTNGTRHPLLHPILPVALPHLLRRFLLLLDLLPFDLVDFGHRVDRIKVEDG